MQNERPRKLQRISQACDLCHRRSIRCRPSNEDDNRCQNCYDFDVSCTYERPSKRRKHPQAPAAPREVIAGAPSKSSAGGPYQAGPLPSSHVPRASASSQPLGIAAAQGSIPDYIDTSAKVSPAHTRVDLVNDDQTLNFGDGVHITLQPDPSDALDLSWKAFALSTHSAILELFDIFVQIIYPLYPLMDKCTVRRRLEQKEHLTDRALYAAIMACCALTSARLRDGAYSGHMSHSLQKPEVSSEIFFQAARESTPKDFMGIDSEDTAEYVSACTFLALTCIQYGQSSGVQQYLGKAFTLAAMNRFYDEQSWPSGIDDDTREMYRRIYWCTYMLDVYSAIVWNCFLRSQEIHAYVRYPSRVNNENLGISQSQHNKTDVETDVSWITGWNFTLDLYRVLEHVIGKARSRKFHHDDRRSVDSLVFSDTFSDRNVMQTMLNMYYELPRQFKETLPMTGDLRKDIFGFQAANIQATLQLMRMMLFSLEDGPGVERKCDVASEVLQVFHTIPVPYLKAISSPLVYQLGSIGMVLGSVLEERLSQPVYERIRHVLVLMADLLQHLESNLHRSGGAAEGIRAQVQKLDEYMRSLRSVATSTSHSSLGGAPVEHKPTLPGVGVAPAQQRSVMDLGISVNPGILQMQAQPEMPLPEFQILPEMRVEWPWQFFQSGSGNYFADQMGGRAPGTGGGGGGTGAGGSAGNHVRGGGSAGRGGY